MEISHLSYSQKIAKVIGGNYLQRMNVALVTKLANIRIKVARKSNCIGWLLIIVLRIHYRWVGSLRIRLNGLLV